MTVKYSRLIEIYDAVCAQHGIAMTWDNAGPLVRVQAELLLDLVEHAVRATGPEGVDLERVVNAYYVASPALGYSNKEPTESSLVATTSFATRLLAEATQ